MGQEGDGGSASIPDAVYLRGSMTIREDYLNKALGSPAIAAALLAKDLAGGDKASFKVGYTAENAVLAARDMFPEVSEEKIWEQTAWERP